MSDKPEDLKVGHRYRLGSWSTNTWVEVLGIGKDKFFAVNQNGEEGSYQLVDPRSRWIEVILPEPIPQQYINVYLEDAVADMAEADRLAEASGRTRLARINTYTDNTGVDRVYLDRV